jgi:hypothetical protein
MKTIKTLVAGISLLLSTNALLAQQSLYTDSLRFPNAAMELAILTQPSLDFLANSKLATTTLLTKPKNMQVHVNEETLSSGSFITLPTTLTTIEYNRMNLTQDKNGSSFFLENRRNRYSALWAFASLNYLYADLVGVMDRNKLLQYQAGVVDGVAITPEFLTVAAGFMQVSLANVFLPQVIKNERTLRWVQIASGTLMTLVQSGTLFVGKPTPYYALFSAFEIGATAYITIDAIRWHPKKPLHK